MPDSFSPSPALPSPTRTPDYGIDAPRAVRNLFIIGGVALVTFLTVVIHLWSGVLTLGEFHFNLRPMSLGLALGGIGMGAWMVLDSKYGKVRERERLLDLFTWTGRERVLDVGCGRGLLLIGAAKRLTAGGTAAGIDLWQKEDLSGNRPEATLEKGHREIVWVNSRAPTPRTRAEPIRKAFNGGLGELRRRPVPHPRRRPATASNGRFGASWLPVRSRPDHGTAAALQRSPTPILRVTTHTRS